MTAIKYIAGTATLDNGSNRDRHVFLDMTIDEVAERLMEINGWDYATIEDGGGTTAAFVFRVSDGYKKVEYPG